MLPPLNNVWGCLQIKRKIIRTVRCCILCATGTWYIYIRLMSTKQISKKNNNKYEQSRGQRMLTHILEQHRFTWQIAVDLFKNKIVKNRHGRNYTYFSSSYTVGFSLYLIFACLCLFLNDRSRLLVLGYILMVSFW